MFIPTPPQLAIAAVLMALSATAGWKITANHYQNRLAQIELERVTALAEAEKMNRQLETAGEDLSRMTLERDAARLDEIQIVEKEVFVNVVEYRYRPAPRPINGTCYIDGDWMRIHNASSTGVPKTTPSAAEPDKTATYADTLDVVTTNYATCHKLRATVLGWQEFYEGLRRLHEN
jgi:hypothetical protein